MDAELQETVEQLVGAGAQVLDCEKRSVVREEEVLLVNGQPLQLQGADGVAIRKALLAGHVPHDLLNTVRAGILRSPVRLETSLQVKSSVVTREEVTVARGGRVVDEHSRQTQEDNVYNSSTTETWEPAPAAGAAAPAAAASAALAAPRRPGPPPGEYPPARPCRRRPLSSLTPSLFSRRHGKAQAPPPPLTAAGGGPLTQCASPPLSSSSSSGFWSPGPGGPAPSRSVSDSSCDSGPPPRPPQPPTSASPGDSDDVDGDLAHGLHAVSLPVRRPLRTNQKKKLLWPSSSCSLLLLCFLPDFGSAT
ncbi:hypothetical protein ONE63_003190 [Megalurothrips usitatus]|uniref:Uncharacterized protein n=1 Tax=Megalurothrips usitatus TaxID=439358 RepID=A0AAV7XAY3_9NEOP|nr:hypothetical protein ONE63_003190 [Megalurothrips usitatus]